MRYVLWFYAKIISPLFPGSCRFYPCCSSYALEAYEKHGFFRGTSLSLKRICKCHPYHKGPCIDEVPPAPTTKN